MNIYQAITAAMADIEPIAKGRKNKEQGFQFRGIDDIMNELQPVLKTHGLFVVPKVREVIRQEKPTKTGGTLLYSIVTMDYTMYAADGSSVSGATVGEGMDSGDKASNKAMAVALKYFLLQTFCIPTEDAKDPDADSPAVGYDTPEFVKLKGDVIDWINFQPPVFNEDWIKYANDAITVKNIDALKKCIETAKAVMQKREVK